MLEQKVRYMSLIGQMVRASPADEVDVDEPPDGKARTHLSAAARGELLKMEDALGAQLLAWWRLLGVIKARETGGHGDEGKKKKERSGIFGRIGGRQHKKGANLGLDDKQAEELASTVSSKKTGTATLLAGKEAGYVHAVAAFSVERVTVQLRAVGATADALRIELGGVEVMRRPSLHRGATPSWGCASLRWWAPPRRGPSSASPRSACRRAGAGAGAGDHDPVDGHRAPSTAKAPRSRRRRRRRQRRRNRRRAATRRRAAEGREPLLFAPQRTSSARGEQRSPPPPLPRPPPRRRRRRPRRRRRRPTRRQAVVARGGAGGARRMFEADADCTLPNELQVEVAHVGSTYDAAAWGRARDYFAPAEDVQLGSAVSSTATIRKGYPKLLRVIAGMLKQPWCGRRRRLEPAGQRRSSQLPLSSPRAPRAPLCRRWTLEKEIIGAFRTSLSAFVVPPGFHVFDFRMGGATLRLVNPDAKGPAAPELDHLVVMAIPSLHLNRAITPSGARHACHRSRTHAHGSGGVEPAAPRAPRAPAATSAPPP